MRESNPRLLLLKTEQKDQTWQLVVGDMPKMRRHGIKTIENIDVSLGSFCDAILICR